MTSEPMLSAYLHARAAREGRPCSGTFELTARCNFNCEMCYVRLSPEQQKARGRELSADQWLRIGEEACREGLLFLLLTGGEPTLRPDFTEIYRGLKKMGLFLSINTNGSLLDGELLEILRQDPPHRINLSLYGASNETYAKLCGVGAYDRVLKALRELREAGIEVKVNLTVTGTNAEEQAEAAALAKEFAAAAQTADYLFPPVRITGSTEFPQRMPPEWVAKRQAARMRERYSDAELRTILEGSYSYNSSEDECAHCRAGKSSFWISWDGQLYPCGLLPVPSASALEIGFSAAWERVRDGLMALDFPEDCRQCSKKHICKICLAKCYAETLGFDRAPEYPCKLTDAFLKEMRCYL